jgi:DNA-binding beta-propeller fold protein YncE
MGIVVGASLLALAAAMAPAEAQELTEAWRATGFSSPESVAYDPGTKTLFVSNINNPDFGSKNGQGYVSQIGTDGSVIKEKFVETLESPKGIDIADGHLYVAGIEELVEVDIAAGQILNRYPAPGAGFLNDVAVAPDGRVFVSETMTGAIYVLADGQLTEWLKDPQLAGANGLYVSGGNLMVAPLGDISGGFANLKPTNIKVVNLETKAITDYGSTDPVGGLDGIEPMGDGWLVTDNGGGRLVLVGQDGKQTVLATPGPGAADLEYVPADGLVVIPMTPAGEVVAYKEGAM